MQANVPCSLAWGSHIIYTEGSGRSRKKSDCLLDGAAPSPVSSLLRQPVAYFSSLLSCCFVSLQFLPVRPLCATYIHIFSPSIFFFFLQYFSFFYRRLNLHHVNYHTANLASFFHLYLKYFLLLHAAAFCTVCTQSWLEPSYKHNFSRRKKSLSDSNSVSTREKNFGLRRHKRHFWTLHCLFTKCLNSFHIRVLNHSAERLKNCCRCCTRHRWTSMHFTVCLFSFNCVLKYCVELFIALCTVEEVCTDSPLSLRLCKQRYSLLFKVKLLLLSY